MVDKNNFSNGSYSESSGKTSQIWHMKVSLLEYFLASEKLYKSYMMSSVALNELCHPWWCHSDVIMVISTWLGDYTFAAYQAGRVQHKHQVALLGLTQSGYPGVSCFSFDHSLIAVPLSTFQSIFINEVLICFVSRHHLHGDLHCPLHHGVCDSPYVPS